MTAYRMNVNGRVYIVRPQPDDPIGEIELVRKDSAIEPAPGERRYTLAEAKALLVGDNAP